MHAPDGAGHGAVVRHRPLQGQNVRRLLRGDHGQAGRRAALRHSAQLQSRLLSAVHPQMAPREPVRQEDHSVRLRLL